MSEPVIEIQGLGKRYKLFRRPLDRVLDVFGLTRLMPWRRDWYDEFWALRGLDLRVEPGERLGIIGRNGAGKSTLLKTITRNIEPTEGAVAVRGRVEALLELGTGFHPEFTGRQNIHASLAYHGLAPSRIRALEEEIIDFAELDRFIDQPVRTYSAGMYARLGFSTATAIEPEVLIIDEVLGAGDAYFSGKCVDRMERLTKESGATVLFVSHDLASVQRLCTRIIWIERGAIHAEGAPNDIIKQYYLHTLEREEERKRRQAAARVRRAREGGGDASDAPPELVELTFRLVAPNADAPKHAHAIAAMRLSSSHDYSARIEVGAPMDNDRGHSAFVDTSPRRVNWSKATQRDGRRVRHFEDCHGRDGDAPFVFRVPCDLWRPEDFTLEIEHASDGAEPVAVQVLDGSAYRTLGALEPSPMGVGWTQQSFPVAANGAARAPVETAPADRRASAEASFLRVAPCDDLGAERFVYRMHEPFAFEVEAELHERLDDVRFGISIYAGDGSVVSQTIRAMPARLDAGRYTWVVRFPAPNLRQGEYICSFTLLPAPDESSLRLPEPYVHWSRVISIQIDEGYLGAIPLGLVALPTEPPDGASIEVTRVD